jgi:Galactose oxidase, central domain/Kelch motif
LVIPALTPLLDDDEYYPRAHAAMALGSFGPAAKSVAPKMFSVYTNVIVGKDRKLAFDLGVSLLGALGSIDPELAAKAEAFMINTGPLNFARFGHSITLLPNGKELIVGGSIHTNFPTAGNRYLASAELYDPATGKWTETGEMHFARYRHRATLLRNGKVLIEGGFGSDGVTVASKDLYDPTTGTWTVVTNK